MDGLIGKNINYSFSPEIHFLLGSKNYQIYNTDDLKILENLSFKGLNVTIPYKQEVTHYIDHLDPISLKLQSINTIINKDNKLYGYNTDYYGFLGLLKKYEVNLENKNILIIGNGATSKLVSLVCNEQDSKSIKHLVRNKKEKNNYLKEEISKLKDIHIVINTTPVGNMTNNKIPFDLDLSLFKSLETVIDLNYNPLNSKLLIAAKDLKLKSINGLYMLVAQAAYSHYLLANNQQILERIDEVYYKVLFKKSNIVLIGMPGAGKSTIGKELSQELEKEFIDTDELFYQRYQKTPAEFLCEYGELKFRELESQIINSLIHQTDSIIATGGGVILNSQNINALKQNGIIVYIYRDLDLIYPLLRERPLIQSKDDLITTFKAREDKYNKSSHLIINNNNSIKDAILKIKRGIDEIINH